MKRRFEEERIHRLQQLVNEVLGLSDKKNQQIRVRGTRYIPKVFNFLPRWSEGNQYAVKYALENVSYEPYIIVFLPIMMLFLYFLQLHLQKQDVREVVARADEELAKWKETPSMDIPHAVKALKYHLEELRLDYDLS